MTNLKKYIIDILLIIIVLIPSSYLRLKDLSYSDYIGDEQKSFIHLKQGQNLFDFFMIQRKGPMQFFVSYIPYFFTGTYRNEGVVRFPFALLSIASVAMFYILVKKITKSRTAAFVAAALLGSNGFFVGFGRIAQYQNLNLLFSFLSIYFAHDLLVKNIHFNRSAMLSVLFFTLSFFSHWDAVYILPVLAAYFIAFIIRRDVAKNTKLLLIRNCLIFGAITILPFMVPYLLTLKASEENQNYFSRRVEPGLMDINYYKFLIDLYNPQLTFITVSAMAAFGALRIKKSWVFIIWGVLTFLIFLFLFRKPGTHIYNFILPALVLAGIGVDILVTYLPRVLKFVPIIVVIPLLSFFYFQSYVYFVDHTREYPWQQKELYRISRNYRVSKGNKIEAFLYNLATYKTPVYTMEQKLPLFGFPHHRYWNEVNAFIIEQNKLNNENYAYLTNEDKSVSEWYMEVKYSDKTNFYGVGIYRPTNFVPDWSFGVYGPNRTVVKEFGANGVVTRVFKIPRNTVISTTK